MAQVRELSEPVTGAVPTHPLEPLSADELRAAVDIVQRMQNLDGRALFETVALHEPDKVTVRNFVPGEAFTREAFVVVLDRTQQRTYEGIVSLTESRVRSWRHVPGVQPRILAPEMEEIVRLVKANPEYREGLRKRGIEDL